MSWLTPRVTFLLLTAALICSNASAINLQTQPATSVALPEGPLKVRVMAVKGIVQFRTGADAAWEKAAQGTELTEGAELRTGPRSAVQFSIGEDQTVTLDRLGTIQILRANFESGKVFTDLGMKYGRTSYDIDAAAREHDAKVRTPSSVLAVRGTKFISWDQPPFAPTAVSLTGRVMFRDTKKLVAVGTKGGGKAKIDTESDSPAATALKTTAVLPNGKFAGNTNAEAMRNLQSAFGGFENLGVASLIDQARLQNFTVIAVLIKEQLFFGMNWVGAPGSDVALQVVSPRGEVVNKANPMLPGFAVYQDSPPADANGVGGPKAVTWTSVFPPGKYTVTATRTDVGRSNKDIAVTIDALRDPTGQANDFAQLTDVNGNPLQFTLNDKNLSETRQVNAVPAQASASKVKPNAKASGSKVSVVSKKKVR